MDVAQVLRQAMAAVEEADLPAELRPVGFAKAFEALLGEPAGQIASRGRRGPADPDGADPLERIAARVGVSLETVESAFVVEGDRVEVVVPPSRLDPAKARATEEIALLVASARQASGLDEDGWTSVGHIREVCENFKRHDPSNFASTVRDMDDVFTVRGSGRERKVRMTAPAWQRSRELLEALVGGA